MKPIHCLVVMFSCYWYPTSQYHFIPKSLKNPSSRWCTYDFRQNQAPKLATAVRGLVGPLPAGPCRNCWNHDSCRSVGSVGDTKWSYVRTIKIGAIFWDKIPLKKSHIVHIHRPCLQQVPSKIWGFPKKQSYPQNHLFQKKPSSYWGTTILGNHTWYLTWPKPMTSVIRDPRPAALRRVDL